MNDNIIDIENNIEENINDNSDNIEAVLDPVQHIQDLEDQLKRAMADYQNLQKRIQAERMQLAMYGAENTLKALIPSLDNYYYASLAMVNSDNINYEQYHESTKLICNNMLTALEQLGLKRILPNPGDNFNPTQHEAVMQIQSQCEIGLIAAILSPGYILHDRVLKVAQVALSQGLSEGKEA